MVLGVADIDRAVGTDRDAVRPRQSGLRGGSAVALPAMPAVARDGGYDAGARVDAADDVVLGLDDEQIAGGIDGEFLGRVEGRGERVAAVAFVAARADAGHRADHPG